MTERKVLPEKYRLAQNLKEGMEVRDAEGVWWEITSILRIYSPLNIVDCTFSDGMHAPYNPKDQVMSR